MAARGLRSPRWAVLTWLVLPDRTDPSKTYLRRLRIVDTPWFGIYLHWIYLPDTDRHPHDHPWPFLSIPLRGSYTEQVWFDIGNLCRRDERTHKRFSVHTFKLAWAHRIDELAPGLLTLVLRGRRRKSWGFWTEEGVTVNWAQYPAAAGAGPDPFDS